MTIPVWFQDWYNNGSGGIAAAAQTYIDRVEADGGAVESIGCVPSAVWDWTAPDYDAAVQTWIAKLITEGFTSPSSDNLSLLNTFVLALKSAGVWSNLDVIQVWAQDSNSVNAGRVNVVNPSDTLATLYNSVSFTNKVGITGDGVSAYVDTGYNPSTYGGNYASGDNFNGCWVHSGATGLGAIVGNAVSQNIRIFNAGTSNHRVYSAIVGSFTDLSGSGWVAANKKTNATASLFKDTTESTFSGMLNLAIPNENMTLLRSDAVYTDAGISIYMAGANMTSDNTAIHTAVNNYLTGVAAL